MQKHTSKSAIFVDTNLGYLALKGPGQQTVDTRSGVRMFGGFGGIMVQTLDEGGQ